MGVNVEEGSKGGPGLPERGKDKQSMPNKGGTIKSDVMEEDQREKSEQSSDQVKFCKRDSGVLDSDHCFFLSGE
jgi:hypothetical protein